MNHRGKLLYDLRLSCSDRGRYYPKGQEAPFVNQNSQLKKKDFFEPLGGVFPGIMAGGQDWIISLHSRSREVTIFWGKRNR